MADPLVRSHVEAYMAEVTPSVPNVPGIDLVEYKETLIERFSNTALPDTVHRLAEDGSMVRADRVRVRVRARLHSACRQGQS